MKKIFFLIIASSILLFGLQSAEASLVDYASELDKFYTAINPANALGKPDAKQALFGNDTEPFIRYATYSGFGAGDNIHYTASSLAGLFNVSENLLASADFFVTDYNARANSFFESAIFSFNDGIHSKVVNYDINDRRTGNGLLAFGRINTDDYKDFFGISGGSTGGEYEYLLFDVGANSDVDMLSENLSVSLIADDRGPGGNNPDIDALGTIRTAPEPASFLLFGLGGAAVTLLRRKKKTA